MKAMLIILIVESYAPYQIRTIEVPMSTYQHCRDIADQVGESIADGLGQYAESVSTECVNQGE